MSGRLTMGVWRNRLAHPSDTRKVVRSTRTIPTYEHIYKWNVTDIFLFVCACYSTSCACISRTIQEGTMQVGYRIVEVKNGKPMSLFHGTNGSREIPLDTWYPATVKKVKDGTNGKVYDSGWHFLPSLEYAESFFNKTFRIKESRKVVKCYVRGNIRIKEHSKKGRCWLADEIMIKSEDLLDE